MMLYNMDRNRYAGTHSDTGTLTLFTDTIDYRPYTRYYANSGSTFRDVDIRGYAGYVDVLDYGTKVSGAP